MLLKDIISSTHKKPSFFRMNQTSSRNILKIKIVGDDPPYLRMLARRLYQRQISKGRLLERPFRKEFLKVLFYHFYFSAQFPTILMIAETIAPGRITFYVRVKYCFVTGLSTFFSPTISALYPGKPYSPNVGSRITASFPTIS